MSEIPGRFGAGTLILIDRVTDGLQLAVSGELVHHVGVEAVELVDAEPLANIVVGLYGSVVNGIEFLFSLRGAVKHHRQLLPGVLLVVKCQYELVAIKAVYRCGGGEGDIFHADGMGRIVDGIDAVAAKTLPFTDRLGLVTGIDALYDDAVLVEGEQHVGDIILVGILVDVSLVHTGTPFAKERLRRGWYGCDGAVVVRARCYCESRHAADDDSCEPCK